MVAREGGRAGAPGVAGRGAAGAQEQEHRSRGPTQGHPDLWIRRCSGDVEHAELGETNLRPQAGAGEATAGLLLEAVVLALCICAAP